MNRNTISLTIYLQELLWKTLPMSWWKMQSEGTGRAGPFCRVPSLPTIQLGYCPFHEVLAELLTLITPHGNIQKKSRNCCMASTTLPAETRGTLTLFNLPVKEIIHQNIISQLMVESSPHTLQLCTSSPHWRGRGGLVCATCQLSRQHLGDGVWKADSVLWCLSCSSTNDINPLGRVFCSGRCLGLQ